MEAIITSVAGISVSVAAYAFKVGGLKWKQKTFYKIAKFILVKIFNEFKDGERIKVLQKILIEKFNSKSMKELKLFLIELKEIEELQKQYNHDDFFEKNKVKIANIESNNGGRGFARVVGKGAVGTNVEWFHQSSNKEARIFSNSATVNNRVTMPKDWFLRWPRFYSDVVKYKKLFKANKFDAK